MLVPASLSHADETSTTSSSLPLGYLSDPDVESADFLEALASGKFSIDNRIRFEWADQSDRRSSTAWTNRVRFGYGSKAYQGLSGYVDGEWVVTASEDDYFVPATGDGTPGRTVIADPPGIELNQAYGQYAVDNLGGGDMSLQVRGGRQRIVLDDSRFIGNVGWRQFEQTFDAVRVQATFGDSSLELEYAYVFGVQRIFGPDGPNPDSSSHFINGSYTFSPALSVTAFAYLLDFEDDDPANSSDTYGVRLTGVLSQDDDSATIDYEFSFAHQTDAGDNTIDYSAPYLHARLGVATKSIGKVSVGYELLGSDDGLIGFRTPLATGHKFNGFADRFLVTPAEGLQDVYVKFGTTLPHDIKASVAFHQFLGDDSGDELGREIDFVVKKKLNENWTLLAKGGFFDGQSGNPDIDRIWVQATFAF
ncbi:MAG: alginate export family protein [Planctomycetota bacterium]